MRTRFLRNEKDLTTASKWKADSKHLPSRGGAPDQGPPRTQTAAVKLKPKQETLLRRIVQTNGGGLTLNSEVRRVFLSLHRLGLAHQKQGNGYAAVHTRAGLDWVRANPPPAAAALREVVEVGKASNAIQQREEEREADQAGPGAPWEYGS